MATLRPRPIPIPLISDGIEGTLAPFSDGGSCMDAAADREALVATAGLFVRPRDGSKPGCDIVVATEGFCGVVGGSELVETALVTVAAKLVKLEPLVTGTGGLEEPNLEGIETEDSDEVEETGDGIAETVVCTSGKTPFVHAAVDVGLSRLVMVGCCCFDLGESDCLSFGEEFEVVVEVQVEGILAAVANGLPPFCTAVAACVLVVGCWAV